MASVTKAISVLPDQSREQQETQLPKWVPLAMGNTGMHLPLDTRKDQTSYGLKQESVVTEQDKLLPAQKG